MTPGEPRVAALIATFQRPDALRAALLSAAAQTLCPARVLVCDDGSQDATDRVVREFSAVAPMPVAWLTHAHTGLPARTRNQALPHLDGIDLVAFLDDDDLWHPDKLERQVAAMDRDGVDVLGTGAELVDGAGRPVRVYRPPEGLVSLLQLAVRNPMALSSVVMRAAWFTQLGGFNEDRRLAGWGEDYDLWLRAAAVGARVANLADPLVVYREGGGIAARVGADPARQAESLRIIREGLATRRRDVARILEGRRLALAAEADLAAARRLHALAHGVAAVARYPAKSSWATLAHALTRRP